MTEIVFKPEPGAGVENKMTLYRAYVNRKPVGLLVRAKNAGAADRLVQHLFTTQTGGRTLVADEDLMKAAENDDDGLDSEGGPGLPHAIPLQQTQCD